MDLNDTTNRVIVVIVLLLIFIGGWWLIARNAVNSRIIDDNDKSAETTSNVVGTSTTVDTSAATSANTDVKVVTVAATTESVTVADQPAGHSVVVASATLAQVGWLAVRDDTGHVLGAARLDVGTHVNVIVDLLRVTARGDHYQVLVYADNGDGQFDLHKDTLVTKRDGGVVGATFAAK